MTCLEELRESGIFEIASGGYICAEDTGYFSVGDIRGEGMLLGHPLAMSKPGGL